MKWAARHPFMWWSLWVIVLAVGVVVMVLLWRSDTKEADRISLIAAAMSLVGIIFAAFALKWTREAVVVADRTLRIQVLSEEMQRLEIILGAIQYSGQDPPPPDSAERLATAFGPFTASTLPRSFALQRARQTQSTPEPDLIKDATKEVADALDAIRIKRASLITD